MDIEKYKKMTNKAPIKAKSKNRPLPKATQKYLDAFEQFKEILDRMEIKHEEYFHFKSTKNWRFDFHLIEYRMLIEIAGGPWSGGRGGKLSNKAWSIDRYDHAEEMGFRFMQFMPADIGMGRATAWLRELKAHGSNQTVPTD